MGCAATTIRCTSSVDGRPPNQSKPSQYLVSDLGQFPKEGLSKFGKVLYEANVLLIGVFFIRGKGLNLKYKETIYM